MMQLKEDASFAGFYLGSLALGVTLVSLRGFSVDLLHLLFGSILAVDTDAIRFVGAIASITFLSLALMYRALVVEAFDAAFLRVNPTGFPRLIQALFLALVVLNLVAGFQNPGHPDVGGINDVSAGGRALLDHQPAADAGVGDRHRRVLFVGWATVVILRFVARRLDHCVIG